MIGEIYKRKKDEEKEQRPWNQAKRYLFGGLKADEAAAAPESAAAAVDGQNKPGVLDALNAKAAEDAKLKGEQLAGQLDVLAENAESATKQTSRSWTSWLTGR